VRLRGIIFWLVLILIGTRRLSRPDPVHVPTEAEEERATDLVISELQRQIGIQYSSNDSLDFRILAFIALALAGTAFVASTQSHGGWHWYWQVSIAFLFDGAASYVIALWRTDFNRGPDLHDFYSSISGTVLQAKSQLISQLFTALDANSTRLPVKGFWYSAGGSFLLVGIVTTVLTLYLNGTIH
jgi:hypothetical protein